jgi:hypothetical protein
MNKGSYNYNNLIIYCNDEHIILNKNYENSKITRDTKIDGICKTDNCNSSFYKYFRNLKKTGPYCEKCTKINRDIKTKHTFISKFGVENPFQSEEIKQKIKNTNLEKYGSEYQVNTDNFKNKSRETCLKKYGVEYSIISTDIKEKIKHTFLEKYGVENPFQSECIKDKIKNTNLEKYGVENPSQNNKIKEKIKKSTLLKYGVDSILKLENTIEKRKQACIDKYGDEIPLKTEYGKQTFRKTCLEKYGVENPSQNPELAEKTSKNCYRRKTYIFPSGKEIMCQGYEPFALDKLIKEDKILEEDIVTGCKNVPTIWYNDADGKKHRHYVDIYIPSQNRCIEIKSTWTAKQNQHNIFLKQNAAKELGYNYEIWIFNSKKELVEIKL